jgi:hypothetical protein
MSIQIVKLEPAARIWIKTKKQTEEKSQEKSQHIYNKQDEHNKLVEKMKVNKQVYTRSKHFSSFYLTVY